MAMFRLCIDIKKLSYKLSFLFQIKIKLNKILFQRYTNTLSNFFIAFDDIA